MLSIGYIIALLTAVLLSGVDVPLPKCVSYGTSELCFCCHAFLQAIMLVSQPLTHTSPLSAQPGLLAQLQAECFLLAANVLGPPSPDLAPDLLQHIRIAVIVAAVELGSAQIRPSPRLKGSY